MKRLILIGLTALFTLSATFIYFADNKATALSGSDFKAGNIITDSNFFNGSAMSASSVQQFLDSKVPNCDSDGSDIYSGSTTRAQYGTSNSNPPPYTCLKSFRQNIPSRGAESGLCKDISAASNKTAAQIIDIVARSCGISHKVLLVLLQKEQSLVTDEWPWPIQYTKATGYGCPDSNLPSSVDNNDNGCYDQYEGFFKQIYYAARQFKNYAKNKNSYNHVARETNFIRYHPNTSCGGKNVYIENQATAGLYNYTPYQPNGSALNHLYGTGNSCSSYGNRNFWRLYNDWFGSTTREAYPSTTLIGDWNGDGESDVGLKRGDNYFMDTNNNGIPNITFDIGRDSDKALVADWDDDGKDEVGLRRGNMYYYDTDNDGKAEVAFKYGRSSDVAFWGDWDGDGDDSIGVKRGDRYYLDYNNDGRADKKIVIGRVSDSPIVGDWDGDGIDEIGLRRGNIYYFDYNNNGKADKKIIFGKSSDKLIIGDWDKDGTDELGVRRGNRYYLDYNHNNSADKKVVFGKTTDQVIVGDWDGDGDDTIGLRRGDKYYYDNDHDGDADVSFYFGYF